MKTAAQLKAERAKILAQAKAITEKSELMSVEEKAQVDGFLAQAQALKADITRAEAIESETAELNALEPRHIDAVQPVADTKKIITDAKAFKVPASAKVYSGLKHFKNDASGRAEAYRFGMWCLAIFGRATAKAFCKDQGLSILATNTEDLNTGGGYLVPEEFDNSLIDLREMYGVARRKAKVVPMMRDTKTIPRRNGGLTAYFVGEGAAGTESTKAWNQVKLIAKKLMVLTRYTRELDEDAVINIGDDLAGEIAYAYANKEDDCLFNGDGSSTYGGIVGARAALTNLSGTIANIAGLIVAAGTGYATDWGSTVLSDFNKVQSLLPAYADTPNAAWYCHKTYFNAVMEKLAYAAGGNTAAELKEGVRTKQFLGYPVEFVQVMPKTAAISQVIALFGDLSLAATMGDRRQTSISFSEEASVGGQSLWERDEIGVRGTERFDINVHDVGNASATAASRQPGPLVGLITAAS